MCGTKPFVVSQEAFCSILSSNATSTNTQNANWNASQLHATWWNGLLLWQKNLFVKSPVHMPRQQTPQMQIDMHPNYMLHDEMKTEDIQPKHALHTTKSTSPIQPSRNLLPNSRKQIQHEPQAWPKVFSQKQWYQDPIKKVILVCIPFVVLQEAFC